MTQSLSQEQITMWNNQHSTPIRQLTTRPDVQSDNDTTMPQATASPAIDQEQKRQRIQSPQKPPKITKKLIPNYTEAITPTPQDANDTIDLDADHFVECEDTPVMDQEHSV
jgi:hypothetical protein